MKTSSQRSVGGANIKGTPAMPAASVRNDLKKLKSRLDIIGLQEFRHRWYWLVLGALFGERWRSYPSQKAALKQPVFGGQGILWKSNINRKVHSRQMAAFDFEDDHSGIMENRWIRAVLLEDRISQLACWYISTHFVVHGDDHGEGPRRQAFMEQNLARLALMLDYCSRTGEPMVLELDANIHKGTWAYFRLMQIFEQYGGRVVGEQGVEFLVVFDGDLTRVVVDKAYVLRPRDIGLKTDHEVRCIDHHLESKATEPAPPDQGGAMTITQRVVRRARLRGLTVLTHGQWGSKQMRTYAERRKLTREGHWPGFRRLADTVVQHITVTLDHGPLTGDFKTDVQTVERIGMERFGSGISYNFLVDMATGMVAVGQPLDSKGTHTVNDKGVPGYSHDQNLAARAIAVLGMPGDELSRAAKRAISHLLAAMVEEGAITTGFDYVPHSLFAYKDCPCDSTRSQMSAIRAAVDRRVANPKNWDGHTPSGPR